MVTPDRANQPNTESGLELALASLRNAVQQSGINRPLTPEEQHTFEESAVLVSSYLFTNRCWSQDKVSSSKRILCLAKPAMSADLRGRIEKAAVRFLQERNHAPEVFTDRDVFIAAIHFLTTEPVTPEGIHPVLRTILGDEQEVYESLERALKPSELALRAAQLYLEREETLSGWFARTLSSSIQHRQGLRRLFGPIVRFNEERSARHELASLVVEKGTPALSAPIKP